MSLPSVMFVYCSLVVTCWERADLLALLCVTFFGDFNTFLYGVLGQVWYLIVSIYDLCLLSYFKYEILPLNMEFTLKYGILTLRSLPIAIIVTLNHQGR